jgi:Trypsin-like peptidase domain
MLIVASVGQSDSLTVCSTLFETAAHECALCNWGAMKRRLFSILILVLAFARAEAGCIDPAALTHSTVSITRYFDSKEEKEAEPGVLGISGTAWFLSPTSMVTVEHVVSAMNLSDQAWKQVEIRGANNLQSIPARIQRLAGSYAEKIALIELQTAVSGAEGFPLRMERLVPEEPVVSIAYPDGRLRVAEGRFAQYGDARKFAGTVLLEMYDGNDRLVLDHGASGAPVLDCAGRVVAVVSNLITTTVHWMSRPIRISTAWGYPNVVSVPATVLKDPRVE